MASQSLKKDIDKIYNYIEELETSSMSSEKFAEKIANLEIIFKWLLKKNILTVHELDTLEKKITSLKDKKVKKDNLRTDKKAVIIHESDKRKKKLLFYSSVLISILAFTTIMGGAYMYYKVRGNPHVGNQKAQFEGKMLAFQGTLLDSEGLPIDQKVDVLFNLYSNANSGTPLFTGRCVGVNGIVPGIDGSFKMILGKDCGMKPIPESILNSYNNLYLGITVGRNKEMTPRYPITTVGYAKNTEQVKGMTLGVEESTIPYIDEEGSLVIGALSPQLKSTRGDFSIEGQTLVFKTTEDSQGSIYFSPDAGGNMIIEKGKVGIGTDEPKTELDVNGNTAISGDVYLEGDSSSIYQTNGGNLTFYTSSDIDDLTKPALTLRGADSPGVEILGGITTENGITFTGSQPKIVTEQKKDLTIGDINSGNIIFQTGQKVAILTSQLLDAVTIGGSVGPSKNDTYSLGSEKRKWSTVYTSDLILDAEGIGGFLRRKAGNLAPTNLDDTLLLGSETAQNASIKLSPKEGSTSWIASGLFGVGTKNPHYSFSALSRTANSSAVSLSNLATTDTSTTNVLRLQLGTTATGANAKFIDFYAGATDDNQGKRVGGIRLQNNGVVYETSGADFAEYMKVNDSTVPGDVVGIDTDGIKKANNKKHTIGVITDVAGFVGNAANQEGSTLVGLQGQIETHINTLHGDVLPGSLIGLSDMPGYGATLTTSGESVGLVLDEASKIAEKLSNNNCPIDWKSKIDPKGNLVKCGRITLLVSIRWHEVPSAKIQQNETRGNAVLPAQTSQLKISTSAVDEKSVILVTPYGETEVQLRVAERGKGYFIIKGGEKNITDVDFGWMVVN